MHVGNSGDVSLEGASFSECTAGDVCLPRLPPPHTHTRTPSRAGSGRRRQSDIFGKGDIPKRATLGLPALAL